MLNHGINTKKADTDFLTVTTGSVGIPFYIGAAPVFAAENYGGDLVAAANFTDAKEKLGYSENWGRTGYGLCEAMYAHLKLAAMGPAIFCNVFDPATHKTAAAAADFDVADHAVRLPGYLADGLTVLNGETTVPDTAYETDYDGDVLVLTLKPNAAAYSATVLNVAGNKADPTAVTKAQIEAAIERIEECKGKLGIVPDLIVIPGWSDDAEVAQLMAAKAANINGIYRGKAVVDLSSAVAAADTYDDVRTYAVNNGYTDDNMIVCWPLAKVGDKTLHMSSVIAGLIAQVDAENDGVPFESPSNKALPITGCVNAAGAEVNLSVGQADMVSISAGVVTALNFGGWISWGNYTGAKTAGETDPAKVFICTNRMQDHICNTFVETFWAYLDRPLTPVLIDAIVNNFNSWLAGLTRDGALYGGEIAYVADNNPTADLLAGKFLLDCRAASPVPAQRIDMVVEFDVELLTASLLV
jgi:phage tail sheath protein FI